MLDNYIEKIIYNLKDRKLYKVIDQYEGNEDMSYHGSSWYDTHLICKDLETDEIKTILFDIESINIATEYIFKLEQNLADIGNISDYYYRHFPNITRGDRTNGYWSKRGL